MNAIDIPEPSISFLSINLPLIIEVHHRNIMKTQELSWFNQFRTPKKHAEIYPSDAVSLPFVPLPRADALCGWCRHDQQQYVITSAEKRSGQISKPLSRLRDGAQKDCWVCKALLNATELWREVDQSEFDRIIAISIRYDAERCIIGKFPWPVWYVYLEQKLMLNWFVSARRRLEAS